MSRSQTPLMLGHGQAELAPAMPFPLAGLGGLKERLSAFTRDPVQVHLLLFEDAGRRYALAAFDLLIVDPGLQQRLLARAQALGVAGLVVHTTHTHSSVGGYVPTAGAALIMGRYRPALAAHLEERFVQALAAAQADLAPVTGARWGQTTVPGLTMNRQRTAGPTDDLVSAVKFERRAAMPVVVVGFSGHPVVAAFMKPGAVSADCPGEVRARLALSGRRVVALTCALGGLNLLFPEMPTDLDRHLELLSGLIADGAERALAGGSEESGAGLRCRLASSRLAFRRQLPPLAGGPLPVAVRAALTAVAGHCWGHFAGPDFAMVPLSVLRAGPLVVAGMPADFGVTASVAHRDALAAAGAPCPMVPSHTDGYVGYLHPESETRWVEESRLGFLLYENAMNWYGADSATRLSERSLALAAQVLAQPPSGPTAALRVSS